MYETTTNQLTSLERPQLLRYAGLVVWFYVAKCAAQLLYGPVLVCCSRQLLLDVMSWFRPHFLLLDAAFSPCLDPRYLLWRPAGNVFFLNQQCRQIILTDLSIWRHEEILARCQCRDLSLCSCSVIFHLVLVLYMKELWKIFRNWTNWITEWKHRHDKLCFIEKADWLTWGSIIIKM